MSHITLNRDPSQNLTTFAVAGRVEPAEIEAAIRQFYSGEITLHVIWDLSACDLSLITPEAVQMVASTPREFAARRQGGKTALVAPDDLSFGLSRMYEIHTNLQDTPFQTQVFRTRGEAEAWLEAPE